MPAFTSRGKRAPCVSGWRHSKGARVRRKSRQSRLCTQSPIYEGANAAESPRRDVLDRPSPFAGREDRVKRVVRLTRIPLTRRVIFLSLRQSRVTIGDVRVTVKPRLIVISFADIKPDSDFAGYTIKSQSAVNAASRCTRYFLLARSPAIVDGYNKHSDSDRARMRYRRRSRGSSKVSV